MPFKPPLPRWINYAALAAVLVITAIWLHFTPPGIEGKMMAIGYAVCHQIPERTFSTGHMHTPLCARCTGMYIGILSALLIQILSKHKGGYPAKKFYPIMILFILAFGIDGINSYLHFFENAPHIYEPQNLFRLLTGSGMGIDIGLLIHPIFHQSTWKDEDPRPAVDQWKQIAAILLLTVIISIAAHSEIATFLYLLSYVTITLVIFTLSSVFTVLWILILKYENTFQHWREIIPFGLAGLISTIFLISLMDFLRFHLTGSWINFF